MLSFQKQSNMVHIILKLARNKLIDNYQTRLCCIILRFVFCLYTYHGTFVIPGLESIRSLNFKSEISRLLGDYLAEKVHIRNTYKNILVQRLI